MTGSTSNPSCSAVAVGSILRGTTNNHGDWAPKIIIDQESGFSFSTAVWQRGGILASHPAAPSSILGVPKNFSFDVAEICWQGCLEQWAEA